MSEVGYNDTTTAKAALSPVHPDQHQKSLRETLENVQQEIDGTEQRMQQLHLIRRSCQSGLEAFEKNETPSQDPHTDRY